MVESNENRSAARGGEADDGPSGATRRARLENEVSELRETIRKLEAEKNDLKMQRDALLEDNRKLRRRVTHSSLVDNLHASLQDTEFGSDRNEAAGDALFDLLPERFRFPEYFRLADDEGLDSNQARLRLLSYLTANRLAQSGAYLEKTGGGGNQRGTGDGQSL